MFMSWSVWRHRRWLVVIGVVVLVVGGGIFVARSRGADDQPRTTSVERRDLVQEATFTGRLSPQRSATLGFAVGGIVDEVPVAEGVAVAVGTTLARLDATVATLEAAQSAAARASGQVEARIAWETAQAQSATTAAEGSRQLAQQQQRVRDAYDEMKQLETVWQAKVAEEGDDSSLARTTYASFLSARTTYRTAQQALTTLQTTVTKATTAAEEATRLAEAQYLSTTQAAPGVAGLSSTEASAARTQTIVGHYQLVAPFAGVVTQVTREPGEYTTPGDEVVRLETTDSLELVADVPETDAVKLALDMTASVTFDAYPATKQWSARVTHVASTATFIEGVPTYEVHLQLTDSAERLKPGLTANITVETAHRQGVLTLPRRAVQLTDDGELVLVQRADGTTEERTITTGLLGSTGSVEILTGLIEGETVLIRLP